MQMGSAGVRSYYASVIILSVGFFGVFMAFNTAQALQTTITDKQLADVCLATLYTCFTAMSIVAPRVVQLLGPRCVPIPLYCRTRPIFRENEIIYYMTIFSRSTAVGDGAYRLSVILGSAAYAFLVFSSMKPSYALSVPAFVLVGCCAAILWTGQGVYLGRSALRHARSQGEDEEQVTSRFNGIFFAAFQFCGAAGTLIASIIQSVMGEERFAEANRYIFLAFGCVAGLSVFIFVGMQPAPPMGEDPEDRDFAETASHTSRTLSTSLNTPEAEEELGLDVVVEQEREQQSGAALPAVSVRPDTLPLVGAGDEAGEDQTASAVTLWETLRLVWVSRALRCILPLIFFNGMSLGFFFSDYPAFYASQDVDSRKLLPPSMVGFITSIFYASNALFSFGFGRLVPSLGRRGIMVIAAAAHACFFALLFTFLHGVQLERTSTTAYVVVIALAIVFAIGDAVWESQIPAVLQSSTFFPKERDRDAAMSNLKMWQSLGFAVQFALGFLIEQYWVKVAILSSLLVVSALLVGFLDVVIQPLDADIHRERPADRFKDCRFAGKESSRENSGAVPFENASRPFLRHANHRQEN